MGLSAIGDFMGARITQAPLPDGLTFIKANTFYVVAPIDTPYQIYTNYLGSHGGVRVAMLEPLKIFNVSTAVKNALVPEAGWLVFDTDLSKLCIYTGVQWQTINSAP